MLFKFYYKLIFSIRAIDPITPIIVESGDYADPKRFLYLKALNFENIIYSFHMYEPYCYTNKKINKGRFSYPGIIDNKLWNKSTLEKYFIFVKNFQKNNKIPSNRILVEEFGGNRFSKGLKKYFSDLIEIFKKNGWHTIHFILLEKIHGLVWTMS